MHPSNAASICQTTNPLAVLEMPVMHEQMLGEQGASSEFSPEEVHVIASTLTVIAVCMALILYLAMF
ncbi:hypothetical protein [Variovorax sp. HJSM1_2]|uniref:hypothetical protein n=1 Tax=Variovorax sp. HJSM1_2 TaxID=3366263 RepID=UPI003BEE5500